MSDSVQPPEGLPERMLDDLYARVPEVGCKGLCTDSCGSIAMSPMERKRIAGQGVTLPLLAAFKDHCPALKAGRCSVYASRPMICRLWGAVEGMKCPHGCTPAGGHITDRDGRWLLASVAAVSRPSP